MLIIQKKLAGYVRQAPMKGATYSYIRYNILKASNKNTGAQVFLDAHLVHLTRSCMIKTLNHALIFDIVGMFV